MSHNKIKKIINLLLLVNKYTNSLSKRMTNRYIIKSILKKRKKAIYL